MYKYSSLFADSPPVPRLMVKISSPRDVNISKNIMAIVDTGASKTCVPSDLIRYLGCIEYRNVNVYGVTGGPNRRKIVIVHMKLSECEYKNFEVLEIDRGYAVIGRDILNDYNLLFDGPNKAWRVNKGFC